MNKAELIQMITESIDNYEKMIEENQDKMIQLQERIQGLNNVNKNYLDDIRRLSEKLRELK